MGSLGDNLAGLDVNKLGIRVFILGERIDEDVETGDPQVSVIFLLSPELVDPLFGDEVEFVALDDLDRVDLGQLDGFLDFVQSLIAIVGETILQNQEIPSLPNRNETRRFFLEVTAGLPGCAHLFLIT